MAGTPKKISNAVYKKGKLSKSTKFSARRIRWTPIIIIICVLVSFILAIIFGNYLGKKAESVQNTPTTSTNSSEIVPPAADKVSPYDELNAYFADLKTASPDTNISLSVITAEPRERGNALFIEFKNENGEIIYSSSKLDELTFEHQNNLKLDRIKNHTEYYNDFVVGYFESDFSASLDKEEAIKLQTNEILLLKEATDAAFDQLVISFSGDITKNTLIHYQAYLLNLKLACPTTPVGVEIPYSFLNNSDNAGSIAGLLGIADYFVLDFDGQGADEIKNALAPLIYFTERYNCVVMLSETDDASLSERILALSDKGINSYIVK